MLRSNISLGISLYGNGGMNTSYMTPIPVLGVTRPGVNLQQMFKAEGLQFCPRLNYNV